MQVALDRTPSADKISSPSEEKSLHDVELNDSRTGQGSKFLGKASTPLRALGTASTPLPRSLLSRHLTFVAIGGTLGTGIFLSLGTSVATAGAGGALLSYVVVGLFCYGTVMTLGEMSSLIPVSGAFSTFGARFVSPALGFALGWSYWLQWSFSIPSELIAASTILSYWTDALNTWQWSLVIIVPVFAFQLLGTRAWGESEYILALIKVILIIVFILVGLIYDWGGVIGHPGPGLSNFNNTPFNGGFAGFVQSCTYAFYSFGGVELVALAAGEADKPQKSIPRAIKATFFRIVLFYILTVLVIGLCIPYDDPSLFTAYDDSDVAASPITTVFRLAGFGAAVHVVNAVLLTAVLSATNSCFYASSRMMVALARQGHAFGFLGWTTARGVPLPALLLTLIISCFTFLTSAVGSGKTFTWLLNITGILALVTWLSISIINLRFRAGFKAQGRDLSDLPFRVALFPTLNICVLVIGFALLGANGWAPTTYGSDTLVVDEIAVYIGLVFFAVLFFGYSAWHKLTKQNESLFVRKLDMDFETGAVWKRGQGREEKEQDAADKAVALSQQGRVKYTWSRFREGLF